MLYDHSQYFQDMRLVAGEATSTIEHTSPITSQEFYRGTIDPGFPGSIEFIEVDLYFDRYSSPAQGVHYVLQILSAGKSSWGTLYSSGSETWDSYAQSRVRAGVAAAALGAHIIVPFQVRLLVTAAVAATVAVRIGTYTPAIRVIGVPD